MAWTINHLRFCWLFTKNVYKNLTRQSGCRDDSSGGNNHGAGKRNTLARTSVGFLHHLLVGASVICSWLTGLDWTLRLRKLRDSSLRNKHERPTLATSSWAFNWKTKPTHIILQSILHSHGIRGTRGIWDRRFAIKSQSSYECLYVSEQKVLIQERKSHTDGHRSKLSALSIISLFIALSLNEDVTLLKLFRQRRGWSRHRCRHQCAAKHKGQHNTLSAAARE